MPLCPVPTRWLARLPAASAVWWLTAFPTALGLLAVAQGPVTPNPPPAAALPPAMTVPAGRQLALPAGKPNRSQSHRAAPVLVPVQASFLAAPLGFEANGGQTDARVKFLARGPGYSLFLTPTEAVFALRPPEPKQVGAVRNPAAARHLPVASPLTGQATSAARPAPAVNGLAEKALSIKALSGPQRLAQALDALKSPRQPQPLAPPAIMRMQLLGASPTPEVTGQGLLPGKVNYFRGRDPKQWHTGIQTFAQVRYQGVYPGVDLLYYGSQRQLEYDFTVAPGTDPAAIRLGFVGADKLAVNDKGDLVLSLGKGEVVQHAPVVYQEKDGQRQAVTGRYVLRGKGEVSFAVGIYDHARPLTIDPVLVYSTYLGGSLQDWGNAVAVDTQGWAYVGGGTCSVDFPTTSGVQQNYTNIGDNFVTKISPDGSAVQYSSFLGDGSFGGVAAVAVDAQGCAYVSGGIGSQNFPITPGAFQSTPGSTFVTKFNASGSALVYSTYLGDNEVYARGIAVDAQGCAYVTGGIGSQNFPVTPGAFQSAPGSTFVTKFNASGSALAYSTFLGDSSSWVRGIAVDQAGCAYVTGSTGSQNFPVTSGAFQSAPGGTFVTKFNATGSALAYSTYLGSSEGATGIAVDPTGSAYVTGTAYGPDLPVTPGAYQPTLLNPQGAGFVAKLLPDGSALAYATYLGGSGGHGQFWCEDSAVSIAVDGSGGAYVVGTAGSPDFPTTANVLSLTRAPGIAGPFLARLNPAGSALVFSSLLNAGNGVAVDGTGSAYVVGTVSNSAFPTVNPLQATNKAAWGTVFALKLSPAGPPVPTGLCAAPGDGWVSLVWQPSPGATGYNVYRATHSGLPYRLVAANVPAFSGNNPGFADLTVTNGVTYYYVVTAVSQGDNTAVNAGESLNSPEASARPYTGGVTYGAGGSTGGGSGTGGSGGSGGTGSGGTGGTGGAGGGTTPIAAIPVASLTLNGTNTLTLPGGANAIGTVTLSQAVPQGSQAVVTVSSTNTAAVPGPFTVIVPGGQSSQTFPLDTSAVNRPVTLTLSAFTTSQPQTATLTLTTHSLRVTDIYMPSTLELDWDCALPGGGLFLLKRDGVTIATLPANTYQFRDAFPFVSGQSYLYELFAAQADTAGNPVPYAQLSAETVVPYRSAASDDQAVDSRVDRRYTLPTLLNHQFSGTAYRGGLFVGHAFDSFFQSVPAPHQNEDASRIGHSFARFPLGAGPLASAYPDGAFLRAGTVSAYLTQIFQSTDPVTVPTVACVPLADNGWSASGLTWLTAPNLGNAPTDNVVTPSSQSLVPDPSMAGVQTNLSGWCHWPMGASITAALQGAQPLSVGWRLADETGWGWAYFAKKEYNARLAPTAMHVWTVPTLADLILPQVSNSLQNTGQVLVNGIGAGEGHVSVALSVGRVSMTYAGPTDYPTVRDSDRVTLSSGIVQGASSITLPVDGLHNTFFIGYQPPLDDEGPAPSGYSAQMFPWMISAPITASYGGRSITKTFSASGTVWRFIQISRS